MEGGIVKPISKSNVHKICSGQVVLTLATAVKELVENSIDAGATNIEVKLKEHGSEIIEVIDNGKGVKASDFQSITLKHHTSKICDFSDVECVSTFGFRGEALSSLCALSNVEIITCHQDSTVGSLLVYDHNGSLIKTTPTHRQTGTTVILRNLFSTLPVRHKEFLRNIRREYAKMIQLLTAYCLISLNKRITCTNITDKGKKSIVLSTNNSSTYKENVACLFGAKQMNSLMEFIQQSPSESVLEEYFLPKSIMEKFKIFQLEGYISNSNHGEGRSSTDRQFFFINGRPCDLPKISKLINEIYHSFNKHQYPFVFLNICLTEGSADVNVTPDKRQIFIPEEKLLLCIIKTSLLNMYQIQPAQIKMSSPSLFFHKDPRSSQLGKNECGDELENSEESLKRKVDMNMSDVVDGLFSPPSKSLRTDDLFSINVENAKTSDEKSDEIQDSPDSGFVSNNEISVSTTETIPNELQHDSPKKLSQHDSPKKLSQHDSPKKVSSSQMTYVNATLTLPFNEEKAFKNGPHLKGGNLSLQDILKKAYRNKNSVGATSASSKTKKNSKQKTPLHDNIGNFFSKKLSQKADTNEIDNDFEIPTPVITLHKNSNDETSDTNNSESGELVLDEEQIADEEPILDELRLRRKKIKTIEFDMTTIKNYIESKKNASSTEGIGFRKFRSKISPTDNNSAEEELKKEIKKEDFSEMDIIGQFNLGFIITRLYDDLFIIDQHATDEKYNFETLQKETVLETQKLFNPQNLNLTAVSEAVLLDNLHIFEKSGFKFQVNEDNAVGNKIQLTSVPMSHNWKFGKEDVEEMIFMLTDNPVSMVRPSRINQMFASRACRKSVMIGTALTFSMMKKLILHMGEIEQPWNCPHGRPTMRHLFNLNLLKTVEKDSADCEI